MNTLHRSTIIQYVSKFEIVSVYLKTGGIMMERVLSSVLTLVSPEMNSMLLQPFERKEMEFFYFV